MEATGTFEVKISPVDGTELEQQAGIGRMTIDKIWSGALTGKSQGAMLTSRTESTGAMAYVALERFEGALDDKRGSFYFSHTATMQNQVGVLNIVVVAGSGTGELAGLSGELTINKDAGGHSYILSYAIID